MSSFTDWFVVKAKVDTPASDTKIVSPQSTTTLPSGPIPNAAILGVTVQNATIPATAPQDDSWAKPKALVLTLLKMFTELKAIRTQLNKVMADDTADVMLYKLQHDPCSKVKASEPLSEPVDKVNAITDLKSKSPPKDTVYSIGDYIQLVSKNTVGRVLGIPLPDTLYAREEGTGEVLKVLKANIRSYVYSSLDVSRDYRYKSRKANEVHFSAQRLEWQLGTMRKYAVELLACIGKSLKVGQTVWRMTTEDNMATLTEWKIEKIVTGQDTSLYTWKQVRGDVTTTRSIIWWPLKSDEIELFPSCKQVFGDSSIDEMLYLETWMEIMGKTIFRVA